MDADALLPEWDRDPGKSAALDARLQELFLFHISEDPRWAVALATLVKDLVANDQVGEALASICTCVANLSVWTYGGQAEAVERFTENLERLRTIARKVTYPT